MKRVFFCLFFLPVNINPIDTFVDLTCLSGLSLVPNISLILLIKGVATNRTEYLSSQT